MPGHPDFDDMVTTTLRLRSGKLADNATVTTALLDRLKKKGKVRPGGGGRTIVEEIEYDLNSNAGWFAGLDLLSTNHFHPFTASEWDWKQAYCPVVWSGRDKALNQGKSEVINLIDSRLKNAEKTLYDLVAQGSYAAGTGSGGKEMGGLQLMIVASPSSGSVGGINRATTGNEFWRNATGSVNWTTVGNIAGSSGVMPSLAVQAMNTAAIAVTRGRDHADLWIADAVAYMRYLESLQPIQRISSPEMAGVGFTNLKFYAVGGDADVVLDNGYCPTETMYGLNTDYIFLRPHEDVNFVPMGGERIPVNQDATIRHLGFMGNMTASNLKLQVIISDTD